MINFDDVTYCPLCHGKGKTPRGQTNVECYTCEGVGFILKKGVEHGNKPDPELRDNQGSENKGGEGEDTEC